ncbi:unnamed protein product [Adineta steineri]|uniref:Uncharacterized protein n=1 Tax=Adineta steineri TaxID=433720 RepID=A0A819I470_9BILA|nr:unnamed protein product [Adineta steineri]CAF1266452.1 unnamed protein product [Adineta steineri]CAF3910608.1 unnamed protein product [Adineta steineri]CAF4105548.1 unnamed protein product [Adineta steineri]
MVKANDVSPIDYNDTSPQSSSINIDQTSTAQSRTLWEQIRTKKWLRIVLLILRSGDAEKTLSTGTTTTETTTATIITTTVVKAATETTTTTSGPCLIYTVLAHFNPSVFVEKSILLVDVNQDAKLDIIVGYDGEETIMIFLNLDDGTFTQSKIVSHEIRSSRITIGDMNNDGKLDIIALSTISMEIIVLYNTGNGNFNNTMIIPTEDMILDVKAVDINKDNKLDLITVKTVTGDIIVFLNDGNGVFSKQIRAIDMNGDNKIDLLVGYYSNFQIHFGFGNSTFADPIEYYCDYQLTSLETADFNNDQKVDIILSHRKDNKISILFNTGNGTFIEQKIIGNIDEPNYAAMIDINSDGKPKLVVVNDQTIRTLYLRC